MSNETTNLSRRALSAISAAALAGTAALEPQLQAATPHPDAELLHLGHELEASWANEKVVMQSQRGIYTFEADATYGMAFDVTAGIVHRIEQIPARTLEGLKIKARAVFWCHAGDKEWSFLDDDAATDERLAESIVNDLLCMMEALS